jgi:hypothetical protein
MEFKNIILFLFLSAFQIYGIRAQDTTAIFAGKTTVVSVGAGLSWGFAAIAINLNDPGGGMLPSLYNSDLYRVSSTPVFNCAAEKRLNRNWSVGAAVSYQSYHVAYSFHDPNNTVIDNNDIYSRTNVAMRALLHLGRNPKLDMYFSGRAGYTFWDLSTSSEVAGYKERKSISDRPSFQVLYGMRYFPGKIGIGSEVGIGTAPYLWMLNICYRFWGS